MKWSLNLGFAKGKGAKMKNLGAFASLFLLLGGNETVSAAQGQEHGCLEDAK